MLLQQAPFLDRVNLGKHLNTLNLLGKGVEVGTHRADYALELLARWKGQELFCVDPWENPPGYEHQATLLWGNGNRNDDREEAFKRIARYKHRCKALQGCSLDVVNDFEDGELSFVYIDGDHMKDAVAADLAAWYPKLKSGGVIAGHDIVCPGEDPMNNWGAEIQPAVFSFATLHDLTVFLIVETQSLPWSYYMVKP